MATGTGRWAHEMARAFPHAQVIGLDMEAPRETYEPPANYQFVQGNLFAGLPFSADTFDVVHQRFLVLALPAKQWPFILSELVRVTRPGGYVELVEGGGTFLRIGPATTQLKQWWDGLDPILEGTQTWKLGLRKFIKRDEKEKDLLYIELYQRSAHLSSISLLLFFFLFSLFFILNWTYIAQGRMHSYSIIVHFNVRRKLLFPPHSYWKRWVSPAHSSLRLPKSFRSSHYRNNPLFYSYWLEYYAHASSVWYLLLAYSLPRSE